MDVSNGLRMVLVMGKGVSAPARCSENASIMHARVCTRPQDAPPPESTTTLKILYFYTTMYDQASEKHHRSIAPQVTPNTKKFSHLIRNNYRDMFFLFFSPPFVFQRLGLWREWKSARGGGWVWMDKRGENRKRGKEGSKRAFWNSVVFFVAM